MVQGERAGGETELMMPPAVQIRPIISQKTPFFIGIIKRELRGWTLTDNTGSLLLALCEYSELGRYRACYRASRDALKC